MLSKMFFEVIMKKVIVIGCPGSGKTTFAEKLHKKTGLPLYYLDAIWHKPDRTHITRDEFVDRVGEIFKEESWIIDGNYAATVEQRIIECDTVFLFDLPTEVCLQGATERLGRDRYDMPWIDKELDPEFRKSIEKFSTHILPYIYDIIDRNKEGKRIIIFKSRIQADEFIEN